MDAAALVGAAAFSSVTKFLPQAWKVARTQDTASISRRMYILAEVGFVLWLTYGLLLEAWPLVVTNGICLPRQQLHPGDEAAAAAQGGGGRRSPQSAAVGTVQLAGIGPAAGVNEVARGA